MDFSDLIYVAFLGIACWLAIHWGDSNGGGGRRARVPVQ